MTHRLKSTPELYDAITRGKKTFEIRRNDRGFQVGDWLLLEEWTGRAYTGRTFDCRITYMTDFEQKPGFVVMSIEQQPPRRVRVMTQRRYPPPVYPRTWNSLAHRRAYRSTYTFQWRQLSKAFRHFVLTIARELRKLFQ